MDIRGRDQPVAAWLDHLRVERGLSENTLTAYDHDLRKLGAFARSKGLEILALRHGELTEFLGRLRAEGLSARSQARHVHALRGFFRFAARERLIERDPTENLRPPRAGRALPRYLTPSQVEGLLRAPDVSDPLGLRDRAILEVMYATGLRASELVALESASLDLTLGIARVLGKGRKERLVPLGREARAWVRRYLGEARARLSKGRPHPDGPLGPGEAARAHRGRRQGPDTPRAAALLRQPPAGAGRGPAGAAGHARARRHLHDPDLHARDARAAAAALRRLPPEGIGRVLNLRVFL